MNYLAKVDLSWTLDYYLEKLSIKLAELFGAFSSFIILLLIVMMFISCILWLILPYIELKKTKILQNIHDHVVESEKLLESLNKQLSDKEEKSDNPFED